MKKNNLLIKEISPYLLQHAGNPVDWFPWGSEAFEKAKSEDKPIFLSIGYSTCHWCHVMEKESFENKEIAEMMNDVFVSIKVDREERPDIDGIYMSVCQMLTGSGGWPLTIIMTPDKNPFFAGTYFPLESRFGRPGMKDLIPQIRNIWKNRRDEINKSALEIVKTLNKSPDDSSHQIDQYIFEKAFDEFKERYDAKHGGFGNAPKFPSAHNLNFLLRYYKRFKNNDALKMAEKTLQEMGKGGIYDHIGFGFHRYSTDREWLVPHFEKMLYDQALLAIVYTEAYQVTHFNSYRQTAEEILEYVLRDMTSPEGGFYSAEDADSDGEEGKFYLWSKEEIKSVLNEEADLIADLYNLKDNGNLPEGDSGQNILYLDKSFGEIAVEKNMTEDVLTARIRNSLRKLFDVREKRVHPYKDDKILTDWNALMISALAKASMVFREKRYYAAGVKAVEFILLSLRDKNNRLLHRYRNGEAGITANIDDYAFTIAALVDLYEADFDLRWLKIAVELNNHLITHFWDQKNGGFYFTPDYGEGLIVRQKEIYDGAIPSGNSIALLNLLRLGRIMVDSKLEEKALKTTQYFSDQINRMPSAFSAFLTGLEFGSGNSVEVIIVGIKTDDSAKEIISYFRELFLPDKIILLKEPGDNSLQEIAPFTDGYIQLDEETTVYICHNYTCERPVTTLDEVKKLIN